MMKTAVHIEEFPLMMDIQRLFSAVFEQFWKMWPKNGKTIVIY